MKVSKLDKYIREAKLLGIDNRYELDNFISNEPELDSINGAEYEIFRNRLGLE